MSKTLIEVRRLISPRLLLQRHTLGGATMGTRYSATFYASASFDGASLGRALSAAVGEVDRQMSNWKEESDLSRLNAAEVGAWVDIPEQLFDVLAYALEVERQSHGAFNIAVGDVVDAWGFGPPQHKSHSSNAKSRPCPSPSRDLELVAGRVRKHAELVLDLNGIAKGYGVDRMAATMLQFGINSWLVGIDGEMRASGKKPDGTTWTVGHERPDRFVREPMGVIELENMSAATSGNYRHFHEVNGKLVSHTIEPGTSEPLANTIASATVLAPTCMIADAWATVLMVLGPGVASEMLNSIGADWIVVHDNGSVQTSL